MKKKYFFYKKSIDFLEILYYFYKKTIQSLKFQYRKKIQWLKEYK